MRDDDDDSPFSVSPQVILHGHTWVGADQSYHRERRTGSHPQGGRGHRTGQRMRTLHRPVGQVKIEGPPPSPL